MIPEKSFGGFRPSEFVYHLVITVRGADEPGPVKGKKVLYDYPIGSWGQWEHQRFMKIVCHAYWPGQLFRDPKRSF